MGEVSDVSGVLILVLVEDDLRADDQKNFCAVSKAVLILVLVEDDLREWNA